MSKKAQTKISTKPYSGVYLDKSDRNEWKFYSLEVDRDVVVGKTLISQDIPAIVITKLKKHLLEEK